MKNKINWITGEGDYLPKIGVEKKMTKQDKQLRKNYLKVHKIVKSFNYNPKTKEQKRIYKLWREMDNKMLEKNLFTNKELKLQEEKYR